MRIKIEQLPRYLQQDQLAAIYCLIGDEALQQREAADQIRAQARQNNYNERAILRVEGRFDWQSLISEAGNLSLFSSRRLLELHLGDKSPGKMGSKILKEYCQHLPADTVLLLTAAKQNAAAQKTAWFKMLEKTAVLVMIQPIELARLPNWIQARARTMNLPITTEATLVLAERAEGHLLAASQELEKLKLLYPQQEIELKHVLDVVADNARFGVFSWIENAVAGHAQHIPRQLQGLRAEGTESILILTLLQREIRLLCQLAYARQQGDDMNTVFRQHRIWQSRQRLLQKAIAQHPSTHWARLLHTVHQLEWVLKGQAKGDIWAGLLALGLALAGVSSLSSNV